MARRGLLRCGPERPDRPCGRALLPDHVRGLDGILEPAGPTHVRDPEDLLQRRGRAPRPSSGRTTPISAMRPRPRWGGRASSTSASLPHGLPNEAVLIGFGTDRGTVAAASDWDEPMEIKTVRPVRADSHERVFRDTGRPCFLSDWRQDGRRELRDGWRARAWSGPSA